MTGEKPQTKRLLKKKTSKTWVARAVILDWKTKSKGPVKKEQILWKLHMAIKTVFVILFDLYHEISIKKISNVSSTITYISKLLNLLLPVHFANLDMKIYNERSRLTLSLNVSDSINLLTFID